MVTLLLVACAPDPSELRCAGLATGDGVELVPAEPVDLCTGARVTGHLDCDGCSFAPGGVVTIYAGDQTTHGVAECGYAAVDEAGDFDLGILAPYGHYAVGFYYSVVEGGIGRSEDDIEFVVCSRDVSVTGTVLEVR